MFPIEEKKISMIDIAKLAGVSVATVSRVLNQNGRYSVETEAKIMALVEKYDYTVNLNAKSLRTSKTHSIGVIVPDITNEFFAKIIRSIENNVLDKGYTVFVCDTNENEEMENFHISSLVGKDVDGIIYISGKSDVKSIYKDYKIPVVYIDRRPENAGTLIISDNEHGGFLATECLLKSGCKKILILEDVRNFSPIRHRYRGYCKALRKYGIPLDTALAVKVQVDYNNAKEIVSQLIKQGVEFDGVFATTDIIGVGALHALNDNGISVPKEVKLVGFDGVTYTEFCNPAMTTIRQNTDEFGRVSVKALFSLIEGGDTTEHVKYTIPVELIERRTTENIS